MTDPIMTGKAVEESAKAAQKVADLASEAGAFFGRVVGDVPQDFVGVVVGDWLREVRLRNIDKFRRRTEEILEARKVAEPAAVSPSIALPLFEAAQDESRDELRELFARLLATAMDPKRKDLTRGSFTAIVKQLDPLDTAVLKALREHVGGSMTRNDLMHQFHVSSEEIEVSWQNLHQLGMAGGGVTANYFLTALGRLFMAAVSD
jgi:hypothetical protein